MYDSIIDYLSGPTPLEGFLAVSLVMFFAGVYGFLSRKNMLMALMSIELMLNAADLNFAVFNRYLYPGAFEGLFFTLFAIAVAAAETGVAIAIIINIYRNVKSIYIDENITDLKE
jgi:NADH-quinone oxidoreductase subunit K